MTIAYVSFRKKVFLELVDILNARANEISPLETHLDSNQFHKLVRYREREIEIPLGVNVFGVGYRTYSQMNT